MNREGTVFSSFTLCLLCVLCNYKDFKILHNTMVRKEFTKFLRERGIKKAVKSYAINNTHCPAQGDRLLHWQSDERTTAPFTSSYNSIHKNFA